MVELMLKIHNLIKSPVKLYILRTSLTVEDSALPLQRAWVLPLDMELRSHVPGNEPLYLKKKFFYNTVNHLFISLCPVHFILQGQIHLLLQVFLDFLLLHFSTL